jgi:hypothetical protein
MENPSIDWLIGFVEGEGNFHISLSKSFKSPTWKSPFEYYPILQFRIFLREDDLSTLEKIKSLLGVGKIYKKKMDYNRKQGIRAKDQYVYYITKAEDLFKLKEIFASRPFHSKKKKDMEVFFKVLDLKAQKAHLTEEGYREIIKLLTKFNSGERAHFRVKPLNE